jgi:hypothetical protein
MRFATGRPEFVACMSRVAALAIANVEIFPALWRLIRAGLKGPAVDALTAFADCCNGSISSQAEIFVDEDSGATAGERASEPVLS